MSSMHCLGYDRMGWSRSFSHRRNLISIQPQVPKVWVIPGHRPLDGTTVPRALIVHNDGGFSIQLVRPKQSATVHLDHRWRAAHCNIEILSPCDNSPLSRLCNRIHWILGDEHARFICHILNTLTDIAHVKLDSEHRWWLWDSGWYYDTVKALFAWKSLVWWLGGLVELIWRYSSISLQAYNS